MRDVHWVDKENMRRSCSLFYYVSIFTLPFPMITSPEGEMRALICPAVTEFNHPQPCCCCSQRNNTLLPATKPASKLLCSSLKTKKSRCENDGFSSDWTTKQLYFFFYAEWCPCVGLFLSQKTSKDFQEETSTAPGGMCNWWNHFPLNCFSLWGWKTGLEMDQQASNRRHSCYGRQGWVKRRLDSVIVIINIIHLRI